MTDRKFPHKKGRFCGTCFGPKREEEDRTMMEIDELIHRHKLETGEAVKTGTLDYAHALRQVKQLIGHARYLELQRNDLRDHLRTAITFCIGRIDPGTLETWKRAIGCPRDVSIHDFCTANKELW